MYKMTKKPLVIFLITALFIGFLYVFLEFGNSLYGVFHKDQPFKEMSSHEEGFPVISTDGSLSIYSFSQKKTKSTNITLSYGGTSVGGESSDLAVASPNFLYTAFIDNQGKDLWVMSNETLEKNQVTRDGTIANSITRWSPDSKKILYTLNRNEVPKMGGGDGEKIVKSKPLLTTSQNLYLYDITTGKSQKLPDIKYFVRFLDNNKILLNPPQGKWGNPGNYFTAFDLSTFKNVEIDQSKLPDIYQPHVGAFTVSKDMGKWAFIYSDNPTMVGDDSRVVLADFPKLSGEILDSGRWADFQSPLFSPSATKLAYWRRIYPDRDKGYYDVIVYDLVKKKPQSYREGQILRWLDDNNLITYSPKDKKYYLINTLQNTVNQLD